MNCAQVLKVILSNLEEDDICLFTTGFISRYAFAIKDRPANFYMIGSMGLVSSVGLGVALNTDKKVIIVDGDGSVLMDMGTMAMVAYHQPQSLCHIVLDNRCYYSTGGQPTLTVRINLARLAKAVGYRKVLQVNSANGLKEKMETISGMRGPIFILVEALNTQDTVPSRVSIVPSNLARRLKKELVDAGKDN